MIPYRNKILIICLSLLIVCLLTGCTNSSTKVSKSGFYFDTIITITLYGTEDTAKIDDCFALASRYEKLFSNHVEDSEISQINALAGSGQWVTVSPETLDVLAKGISYGQLSDGVFDITIGALSDLWNIPEISANLTSENNEADASVLPSPDDIAAALQTVDYSSIEIDGDQVRINSPETKLDLGGIAKGYIADRMKAYLVEQGIKSAIINLGGNVNVIGCKPDHNPFNVGVQMPFEAQDVIAVLSLADTSCVTSGVYERYYRIGDKLYHHILNLETGYPCDNDLYSVTIVCQSSMDADALSTVCFSLGLEKGMELIESLDQTEALFVTDELKCFYSSGMDKEISIRQ